MPTVQVEPLKRLLRAIFEGAGCPPEEAGRIAHYLTRASLAGHDSHGVIRTQRYVEWLRDGLVLAGQHVEPLLDQARSPSWTASTAWARRSGRSRSRSASARRASTAWRSWRCATPATSAALATSPRWAWRPAGLLHFVNVFGSLLVAPFGGRDRRFSTNPVAIGVPTGTDEPFILDFATALVAEGKVLVAHQGGPAVPVGALVSAEGELTNDPHVLYGDDRPGQYPDPRRGTAPCGRSASTRARAWRSPATCSPGRSAARA